MRRLLLSVLVLSVACKKDGKDTDTDTDTIGDLTPAQALHDRIVGSWSAKEPGMFHLGEDPSLDSVVFQQDGSGTFTYREKSTGMLICMDVRWDTTDHSIVLDFQFNELALYLFDGLWSASFDGDTLTLVPDTGIPTLLEPEREIAQDHQCAEVTVEEELATDRGLYSDANIVYEPSQELFYLANQDEARMDPVHHGTAPIMAAPWFFTTSNARSPQAYDVDNDRIWFLDAAHHDRLLCRDRMDADCGTLDTTALGHEMRIDVATIDDDGWVWVHGRNASGERELVQIDPSGPSVEDTVDFDAELRAMVWMEGMLYAITDEMAGPLLEVDAQEGTVERTLQAPQLPLVLHRWKGITVAEGDLWVAFNSQFEGDDPITLRRLGLPDAD